MAVPARSFMMLQVLRIANMRELRKLAPGFGADARQDRKDLAEQLLADAIVKLSEDEGLEASALAGHSGGFGEGTIGEGLILDWIEANWENIANFLEKLFTIIGNFIKLIVDMTV